MDEEVEQSLVEGGSLLERTVGVKSVQDDDGKRQINNGKTNWHDNDNKKL